MTRVNPRNAFRRSTTALAVCLLVPVLAAANDGPAAAKAAARPEAAKAADAPAEPAAISANRPGFGETADVVGRGVLQFESGIVFDSDRAADVETRTMSGPVSLVRVGLARRVEVQVASEGLFARSVDGPTGGGRISGRADLDLGLKAKIATEAEAGINVALLAAVNLPTGGAAFSSGSYDPTVKIAFAKSLPAGLSVGGNVQVASTTVDSDRVLQQALSAAAARGFGRGWSLFGEVYRVTAAPDGPATTSVDAGVSRIVGTNLQLDVSVGRGISRAATDWFVAFGFAVRRPGMFGGPRERQ